MIMNNSAQDKRESPHRCDIEVLDEEFSLLHEGEEAISPPYKLFSEQNTADTGQTECGPPATFGDPNDYLKFYTKVHSLAGDGRTALCLSGGGIRSAAFNLGVLQALACL